MILWAERNIQLFCFLVGLICSLPLILATPPFEVPDEPQHFYRAYQISEGNLFADVDKGIAGGMLPSSLIDLSANQLRTRAIHADRPIVRRPLTTIFQSFNLPLNSDVREFIDFSGAASYSPLPYIPQSFAIAVGRIFNAGPLELMYLARLANAVVAIFLLSLAVSRSPLNKSGFMLIGLLPMSLYLFASVSPDALMISSAFLFTAIALKAYVNRNWIVSDLVIAITCATVFCSLKIVYAPLLLIAIYFPSRNEALIKSLVTQLAIIIIPLIITIVWLHAVSNLIVPVRPGTNVAEQLHHIINQPLRFLLAVANGFIINKGYVHTTIGMLGWLTLQLPLLSYLLPFLGILISIFASSEQTNTRPSFVLWWWALLALASIGLIMLAIYLYWNVVGAAAVDGVQGRYFIPALPMLVVVAAGVVSKLAGWLSASRAVIWISAIGIVEAVITVLDVIHSYWTM